MALFSEGGFSSPDIYIIIYLIFLSAIGVTLNMTVIRRNLRRSPSVARNLYLSLFITDFLSCATIPIYFAYATFMPKDRRCYEAERHPDLGFLVNCTTHYLTFGWSHPSMVVRLYSNFKWTIITVPCVVTACLASCRFYQIRYPFSHLSSKLPLGIIFITTIVSLVMKIDITWPKGDDKAAYYYVIVQGVFVNMNGGPFKSFGLTLNSMLQVFIATNIFNFLAQVVGLIASILTIRELIRNSMRQVANSALARSESRKRRSTIMILVYNFGSFLTACSHIGHTINTSRNENMVQVAIRDHHPITVPPSIIMTALGYSLFVPTFCSLVNPIVFIMFTPKRGQGGHGNSSVTSMGKPSPRMFGLSNSKVIPMATVSEHRSMSTDVAGV